MDAPPPRLNPENVDVLIEFHPCSPLSDYSGDLLICFYDKGIAEAYPFPPGRELSDSSAVLRAAGELREKKNKLRPENKVRILLDRSCDPDTAVAAVLAYRVLQPGNATLPIDDFAELKSIDDWTELIWPREDDTFSSRLRALASYATRDRHGIEMPCPPYLRLGALIRGLQYFGVLTSSFESLIIDADLGGSGRVIRNYRHPLLTAVTGDGSRWASWWDWLKADYLSFMQSIRSARRVTTYRTAAGQGDYKYYLFFEGAPAKLWRYWCHAGALRSVAIRAQHVIVLLENGEARTWSATGIEPLPDFGKDHGVCQSVSDVEERVREQSFSTGIRQLAGKITGYDYLAAANGKLHQERSLESVSEHDLLLGSVPKGTFRFAAFEVPDPLGDLNLDCNKEVLKPLLWRLIRPNVRSGFPLDFDQRHIRSERGILCTWSRSGLAIAYTAEGLELVGLLAAKFKRIAEVARASAQLVEAQAQCRLEIKQLKQQLASNQQGGSSTRESRRTTQRKLDQKWQELNAIRREADSVLHDYSELKAQLADPNYRLLRRFWDAVNRTDIMETIWKTWDSDRQNESLEAISAVQVKLEWFEALIIGFYAIEFAAIFAGLFISRTRSKEPLEYLVIALFGLGAGIAAYYALVDPKHERTVRREKSARIVFLGLALGTLVIVIVWAVLKGFYL